MQLFSRPNGLLPTGLFCPWDFAGKNTGVGCPLVLQGIFLTQGSDLHRQADSLPLGKPIQALQFSSSVVSDSLRHHEPQHARPPCPSPTPRVYPDSCPLSQWCHPTISSSVVLLLLPSVFPSIRVFSSESALHIRCPKYCSFNIRPSSEYSGLISFRIDWLDLLAVQGTLKGRLQCHSLKASVLPCSAFFMIQFSHPYMTTGKTIALIIWTFVGKVMPLLFHMLSRFVIAFLPRSKCLLTSWLQSLS